MIIGIYGFIGSGKTTVANYLKQKYNFQILDGDLIGKQIMNQKETHDWLKNNYPIIFNKDGKTINQKTLKTLFFKDQKASKNLNNFIWPKISNEINQILQNNSKNNFVIDAAILPKLNFNDLDLLIYLKSKPKFIYQRVDARDSRLKKETKSILKTQYKILKFEKQNKEITIENNEDLNNLFAKIDELIENQITKT